MKKILTFLLIFALLAGMSALALTPEDTAEAALDDVARYIQKTVTDPQVGSIGGEWAVIGLARGGYPVPEGYYANVEDYVKEKGGVLHDKKYTEYSRVILALTAMGKDPRNVAGYDLTLPLGDYDKTVWQGLNGPIWALIALDSANYPVPVNPTAKTQATRQMYVDCILGRQLASGGWSLNGKGGDTTPADPDITGMALQALAKYQDQPAVAKATQEALACMSGQQDDQGGFSSWGTSNSESCVQVMVALCELGIPLDDPRFVKNGNTLLDNLLTFYRPGEGFLHTGQGSGSSQMATEQGFYALVALDRAQRDQNSLYDMTDVVKAAGDDGEKAAGLPGKDPAVLVRPITQIGKTFPDVQGLDCREEVEELAQREIINGRDGNVYVPEASMTRSEFASIVVKALGLQNQGSKQFPDVKENDWFAAVAATAGSFGIVNGDENGNFNPGGTITRQEAAIMLTRAAKLCGMDTAMTSQSSRDALASFADYRTVASWAYDQVAFCYQEDIFDNDDLNVEPTRPITRGEVAQAVYQLLDSAKLL